MGGNQSMHIGHTVAKPQQSSYGYAFGGQKEPLGLLASRGNGLRAQFMSDSKSYVDDDEAMAKTSVPYRITGEGGTAFPRDLAFGQRVRYAGDGESLFKVYQPGAKYYTADEERAIRRVVPAREDKPWTSSFFKAIKHKVPVPVVKTPLAIIRYISEAITQLLEAQATADSSSKPWFKTQEFMDIRIYLMNDLSKNLYAFANKYLSDLQSPDAVQMDGGSWSLSPEMELQRLQFWEYCQAIENAVLTPAWGSASTVATRKILSQTIQVLAFTMRQIRERLQAVTNKTVADAARRSVA